MKKYVTKMTAYLIIGLGLLLIALAAMLLIVKTDEISVGSLVIIALFWGMLVLDLGIKLTKKSKKP